MLKMTDIKLELMSDIDMFQFITGAQPKAGTGHKMQTVSVFFST